MPRSPELFRLDGKVALVTGGSGRLGNSFADALVRAGARVVLAGRDEQRLGAVRDALGREIVDVAVGDVSEEAGADAVFAVLADRFGALDILVNSAGTASHSGFEGASADELGRVFATNVASVVLCAQRAAELMRNRLQGKIVNVGSIYGTVAADPRIYEGAPAMVQCSAAYAASKSALVNLTRDLAVRLARWNIQVNMISPGGVEDDQPAAFKRNYARRTPAGRMARPHDLAGTLLYLVSSASDYVTGQNIHVDGGFTAW